MIIFEQIVITLARKPTNDNIHKERMEENSFCIVFTNDKLMTCSLTEIYKLSETLKLKQAHKRRRVQINPYLISL